LRQNPADFQTAQRCAQAVVDAQAEGGVPVDLAVDDDLTRLIELRRVAAPAFSFTYRSI